MHDQPENEKDNISPAVTAKQWSGVERRRWPRPPEVEKKAVVPDPPALTPLSFSTKNLPLEEQFEAWRAYMAPVLDVLLPDDVSPQDGFDATHTVWHLGKILLVQQTSDAYRYIRTAAKLRYSPIDHWYLGMRRMGNAWTEVDGNVIKTEPGNISFRTLGHPYRGRCTRSEIILLYMPYNFFAAEAGTFKTANNSLLSGNLTDLLFNYMSQIEARLSVLTASDLPRIVRTIRGMIINGIAPLIKSEQNMSVQVNWGTMERLHHYIHHHLYDPQLTPDRLCRAVGISRTRLYQLFEQNGGVLNYIRKQRLQAAYEDLIDQGNYQKIFDIGQKAGFDVAANFTRAFINEFGLTPSQVRKKISIICSVPVSLTGTDSGSDNFESWIKNLGS